MAMDIDYLQTDWLTHEGLLRDIRTKVFVQELGVPENLEFDVEDGHARHFLALNKNGKAVGCARLLDSGQLGRVAVPAEHRNQRIGQGLIRYALETAKNNNLNRVHLNAQVAARRFYERLDFRACSEEFIEAGIAHIRMELALPITFTPSGATPTKPRPIAQLPPPAPNSKDHRVSKLREFFNEVDALSGLLQVVHSASRTVKLYSPELDHLLFDTPDMVQMLSEFVRSAPSCRVDILITHTKPIVSRGHTLLELARRLDGKISMRRIPDGMNADAQSWLIADTHGLWVQSDPEEYRGWSDPFNPVQAERYDKRYTHFWDRSVTDTELRVLRL